MTKTESPSGYLSQRRSDDKDNSNSNSKRYSSKDWEKQLPQNFLQNFGNGTNSSSVIDKKPNQLQGKIDTTRSMKDETDTPSKLRSFNPIPSDSHETKLENLKEFIINLFDNLEKKIEGKLGLIGIKMEELERSNNLCVKNMKDLEKRVLNLEYDTNRFGQQTKGFNKLGFGIGYGSQLKTYFQIYNDKKQELGSKSKTSFGKYGESSYTSPIGNFKKRRRGTLSSAGKSDISGDNLIHDRSFDTKHNCIREYIETNKNNDGGFIEEGMVEDSLEEIRFKNIKEECKPVKEDSFNKLAFYRKERKLDNSQNKSLNTSNNELKKSQESFVSKDRKASSICDNFELRAGGLEQVSKGKSYIEESVKKMNINGIIKKMINSPQFEKSLKKNLNKVLPKAIGEEIKVLKKDFYDESIASDSKAKFQLFNPETSKSKQPAHQQPQTTTNNIDNKHKPQNNNPKIPKPQNNEQDKAIHIHQHNSVDDYKKSSNKKRSNKKIEIIINKNDFYSDSQNNESDQNNYNEEIDTGPDRDNTNTTVDNIDNNNNNNNNNNNDNNYNIKNNLTNTNPINDIQNQKVHTINDIKNNLKTIQDKHKIREKNASGGNTIDPDKGYFKFYNNDDRNKHQQNKIDPRISYNKNKSTKIYMNNTCSIADKKTNKKYSEEVDISQEESYNQEFENENSAKQPTCSKPHQCNDSNLVNSKKHQNCINRINGGSNKSENSKITSTGLAGSVSNSKNQRNKSWHNNPYLKASKQYQDNFNKTEDEHSHNKHQNCQYLFNVPHKSKTTPKNSKTVNKIDQFNNLDYITTKTQPTPKPSFNSDLENSQNPLNCANKNQIHSKEKTKTRIVNEAAPTNSKKRNLQKENILLSNRYDLKQSKKHHYNNNMNHTQKERIAIHMDNDYDNKHVNDSDLSSDCGEDYYQTQAGNHYQIGNTEDNGSCESPNKISKNSKSVKINSYVRSSNPIGQISQYGSRQSPYKTSNQNPKIFYSKKLENKLASHRDRVTNPNTNNSREYAITLNDTITKKEISANLDETIYSQKLALEIANETNTLKERMKSDMQQFRRRLQGRLAL